ncbi:uncharacterized protein [Chlorocebus sabaeus]|uniref:uncharacterized protein isoform X2 n=1 Tax=Chlorocebus sabaeus TaxID=60711 RepID=UPI003BF97D68
MCLLAGPLGTRPLALRGLCSCCSLLSQRTTVTGAPRPSVRSDLEPSDRLLPVPGRRRWCPGRPLVPPSRQPGAPIHKTPPGRGHTHTHTHTHTPHTHYEKGSLILSHWRLGSERKIVWVNSQASRLNARLPPPPLHPLQPPPLPFNATRHPHSAPQPGPERAPRVLAGVEGSPGSKGCSPEGTPSLLCPGGQKRTAGRWDRPGPRNRSGPGLSTPTTLAEVSHYYPDV